VCVAVCVIRWCSPSLLKRQERGKVWVAPCCKRPPRRTVWCRVLLCTAVCCNVSMIYCHLCIIMTHSFQTRRIYNSVVAKIHNDPNFYFYFYFDRSIIVCLCMIVHQRWHLYSLILIQLYSYPFVLIIYIPVCPFIVNSRLLSVHLRSIVVAYHYDWSITERNNDDFYIRLYIYIYIYVYICIQIYSYPCILIIHIDFVFIHY